MGKKLSVEQLEEEKQDIIRRMKLGKGLYYREPKQDGNRGIYLLDGRSVNGVAVKSLKKDGLVIEISVSIFSERVFHNYELKQ